MPMELLAPAGNPEKLEIAIHYGADAVYLAGKDFSLRNQSGNFTIEQMEQGIALAHARGVKVYVACNIYPRTLEMPAIEAFLKQVGKIGPDAVIVADPGIFMTVRRILPQMTVHISTQANTTNLAAAQFWRSIGAARINAARELNLAEIAEIAGHSGLEVEAFVHGAMCIAYSGRCLLSGFMAGRDSNRGRCAHPCRWQYAVMEQTRAGQHMPIAEDTRGTYIFNSRDLCMIDHLPEIVGAGISSIKIEGRMKGIHYLATVLRVYRQALDACLADPKQYRVAPAWVHELARVNARGYCRGFYFNDPTQILQNYAPSRERTDHIFVGKVLAPAGPGRYRVQVRNKFESGEILEILKPTGPVQSTQINAITDADGFAVNVVQPGAEAVLDLATEVQTGDLLIRQQPSS
ncbi:MAG: U32 family peptidase [Desulfobacterales bacterium]|nr:U32 family peptidase [Desulfobacterales bacterium]